MYWTDTKCFVPKRVTCEKGVGIVFAFNRIELQALEKAGMRTRRYKC